MTRICFVLLDSDDEVVVFKMFMTNLDMVGSLDYLYAQSITLQTRPYTEQSKKKKKKFNQV